MNWVEKKLPHSNEKMKPIFSTRENDAASYRHHIIISQVVNVTTCEQLLIGIRIMPRSQGRAFTMQFNKTKKEKSQNRKG